MIISKLQKQNNGLYQIEIEDKTYSVTEESVLKYRLFKGYDLSKAMLEECLALDEVAKVKHKAYIYALKYAKNSYETLGYLLDKDIPYPLAKQAVDKLLEENLIPDKELAKQVAASLARASNGPFMIRYKLKNRHFSDEIIEEAISSLLEEDINEGKAKLLKKGNTRYKDLDTWKREQKMKELFFRHGYESA